MLIYLLKVTLVWAASLLLFEVLLKRLAAHHAARAYLLGTLLLGIVLPLVSIDVSSESPVAPIRRAVVFANQAVAPVARVASPPASTSVHDDFAFTDLLWLIWGTGAVFILLQTCWQAACMARLGRAGRSTAVDGCILTETGGSHAPFSFFNRIFIRSRADYSGEEWCMVWAHERCHAQQRHSADVVLLQLLRAAFWFHPAVHWYNHRLRMVHEYAADAVAARGPAVYGRFLLEQISLRPLPAALAISFSHSPIKSRIAMLLRRSSTSQRAVYLSAVPLLSLLLLCCTHEQPSVVKSANSHSGKDGNVFEMSNLVQQPMMCQIGDTGIAENSFFSILPRPVKMNGEPIYEASELTKTPAYKGSANSVTQDLFNRIKFDVEKLQDGGYVLEMPSIVVDRAGKVVYQDEGDFFSGLESMTIAGGSTEASDSLLSFKDGTITMRLPERSGTKPNMDDNIRRDILSNIHTALEKDVKFSPGEMQGKPVVAYVGSIVEIDNDFSLAGIGPVAIVVKKGKAHLVNMPY